MGKAARRVRVTLGLESHPVVSGAAKRAPAEPDSLCPSPSLPRAPGPSVPIAPGRPVVRLSVNDYRAPSRHVVSTSQRRAAERIY